MIKFQLKIIIEQRQYQNLPGQPYSPNIISFNSEATLRSYQYKKDQYDFIIDPTDTITLFLSQIGTQQFKISQLEKCVKDVKDEIKNILFKALKDRILNLENEMIKNKNESQELIEQMNLLIARQARMNTEIKMELLDATTQIEKVKTDQRYKIMKEKKGLYVCDWKYERKTWKAANNVIYFDIGQDYLFEKHGEVFKKIMIHDFLAKHQ